MILSLYRRTFGGQAITAMAYNTQKTAYNYIRKKELDQIEQAHGSTFSQKLIMYSKQAKYIYSQGWAALKKDIGTFLSLRKKEKQGNHVLTHEQQKLKKRLWREAEGLKTLFIIQILPFSGPLLIYYLYVYPTSIPSWFSVDALHEQYMQDCIQKQAKAVEYFKNNPLHKQHLKLLHLKLQELKKLSQLFFGHFQDGVTGYNKIMAPKRKEYLMHPSLSKYLVVRNLKKQFKEDIINNPQIKDFTIQQLTLWKYQRVMSGKCRIKYEPLHDDNHSLEIDENAVKVDVSKKK